MARRWNLKKLVNFEELLAEQPEGSAAPEFVRGLFTDLKGKTETEQRRNALLAWYEKSEGEYSPSSGERILFALKSVSWILCIVSFLAGAALMAGLIERIGLEGKAYNVWKVLAMTVGLQWVFLIASLVTLLFLKRGEKPLSFFEQLLNQLIKRFAGKEGVQAWNALYRAGRAYQVVMSCRFTRLLQGAAIWFNVGLILSLASSLWFLEISFFWASTVEELSRPQLYKLTQFLSLPWRDVFPAGAPSLQALELTQLEIGELNPDGKPAYWYPFLFCTFFVWGLLPRFLLWLSTFFFEARAIQSLSFMEKRHRDLWRSFSRVSGAVQATRTMDEIVVIDVGGIEVETEIIRPFLLQKLRVHPAARFTAATLDGNDEVLSHLSQSPQGALFLVESWNLSPKQMSSIHQKVRAMIGDSTITYLVVGLPKSGIRQRPEESEFRLWRTFIVELDDPNAEVFAYEPNVAQSGAETE